MINMIIHGRQGRKNLHKLEKILPELHLPPPYPIACGEEKVTHEGLGKHCQTKKDGRTHS
jgi:hypothetical protein